MSGAPEGSTDSGSDLKRPRDRATAKSLIRQTGAAGDRTRDTWVQGELIFHYTTPDPFVGCDLDLSMTNDSFLF